MINTTIPGEKINLDISRRIHRIFIYKIFRTHHAYKKEYFDKQKGRFSEKKIWQFSYAGPYDPGEDLEIIGTNREILKAPFFHETGRVIWIEGGRNNKRVPHDMFCATSKEITDYFLDANRACNYSSGLIYIFNESMDWAIRIRSSLRINAVDDADYIYQVYRKK